MRFSYAPDASVARRFRGGGAVNLFDGFMEGFFIEVDYLPGNSSMGKKLPCGDIISLEITTLGQTSEKDAVMKAEEFLIKRKYIKSKRA